jgi:trehalose 6-phosphate synthase
MSKLIVVTNREPYALKRTADGVSAERQNAGLLGALEPILLGNSGVWISWSGVEREGARPGEGLPETFEVEAGAQRWTLQRLPLSEREASLYHYGWACRTQWPLMHLLLGRGTFDAEAWRAYKRVSQRFCDAVVAAYQPGDRVWIHEHHLALVPGLVRAALPDARILYSWNLPWPPVDALAVLPWAGELVAGVLGADVVGVSLPRYGRHLAAAAEAFLGARSERASDELTIEHAGRATRVAALPLGCDVKRWEERAKGARGTRTVRLRRNLGADRLALAVDRVDATRGIPERLRAVERFFDRYPSWRGRLVFCQIAVPSRTRVEEYRDMKKEIDGLVERINKRFATDEWQPVRYLYRALDADELAVYYASADVLLATPLADGLGFVPLEYLAARERGDGALVLSALSAAAEVLPEAVRVNPYDEEAMASALHGAVEQKPTDAQARMRTLRERVRGLDLGRCLDAVWRTGFEATGPASSPDAHPAH